LRTNDDRGHAYLIVHFVFDNFGASMRQELSLTTRTAPFLTLFKKGTALNIRGDRRCLKSYWFYTCLCWTL